MNILAKIFRNLFILIKKQAKFLKGVCMIKQVLLAFVCVSIFAEENELISAIRKADNIFYEGVMQWSKNVETASIYLKDACGAKHPGACLYLGQYYEMKSRYRRTPAQEAQEDIKMAQNHYKQGYEYALSACESGAAEWCAIQAVALIDGRGIEKNISKGLEYLEILCSENIASACMVLTSYYGYGLNVQKDAQKAKDYAQKTLELDKIACEAKEPYACVMSAEIYQQGLNLAQDFGIAKQYYGYACDLGNLFACEYAKKLK